MITNIICYANSINSSTEVLSWIRTIGAKSLTKQVTTPSALEHIVDYMNSNSAPKRLQKMSIKDATRLANQWSKRSQAKGRDLIDSVSDIKVIYDFPDGSMIVQLLTQSAFKREGFLMAHCVGEYKPDTDNIAIYSYRDSNNMPHATFEARYEAKEITQIKGKGNGPIHDKYIEPILVFLEQLGQNVRDSDMENLGYYIIPDQYSEFLQGMPSAWAQVVTVRGKHYAH